MHVLVLSLSPSLAHSFIHSTYKHSQVDHITQTIAYPDEIENDDWLNDFYANVS